LILIDTSVWVDHFRKGNSRFKSLLAEGIVLCHPIVMGELACGNLRNRKEVLNLLAALPQAQEARHDEVLGMIEGWRLMSRGIGYADMQLLASALLNRCPYWTLDRRVAAAADTLNVGYEPETV